MIKWNQKAICVSVCMNSCKKKKSWLMVLLCFFCIIVFNRWFAIMTAFTSARLYNLRSIFVCLLFCLGLWCTICILKVYVGYFVSALNLS